MAIRETSGTEFGVHSGYGGNPPEDGLDIPACTIEDVDRSLVSLIKDQISPNVETKRDGLKPASVVFATGERHALIKRQIIDPSGMLILPIIAVRRTGIRQTHDDMTSRGINQHTGDLVVKRRLAPQDRQYQNIKNKFLISNQKNVGVSPDSATPQNGVFTLRTIGSESESQVAKDGAFLSPRISDNIYEIITIPQPQFVAVNYEISLFTQFTQHMNQIIQRFMSTYLPQGKMYRLETPKGYWFVVRINDEWSMQDNFEEFSNTERIIIATVSCEVAAYMLPGEIPGEPFHVRKYFSAPQVNFTVQLDVQDGDRTVVNADNPDYLLDDEEPTTKLGARALIREKNIQRKRIFSSPIDGKSLTEIFKDEVTGETILREL